MSSLELGYNEVLQLTTTRPCETDRVDARRQSGDKV
jgi:hypothetical protein